VRVLGRLGVLALLGYLAALGLNRSLVVVHGRSMEPTLRAGDRLLTLPARRWMLRPGQVVVVRAPGGGDHLVVKRLVDLELGTVEVLGDEPDASTDSRTWGRLPLAAVRRIAVARWPDVRTPLRRVC
jgi:nickel-type superoxide dismutase maturation protease